ncbi:hypothetical protein AK812_SmicGene40108 [Symbiodinium microadriaticum]|uniref:Uncharacterized protein n=1 Tax=Symbiodinium microadriaticum TaxID=2951 RepID=A0A1Q9C9J4_SYMMI|nr:hypothetical protein AK812_SmicGene40108 [Symbiodinium microadriaticum]
MWYRATFESRHSARSSQAPTAMPARTLLERVSGRITVSKARRARADAEKESVSTRRWRLQRGYLDLVLACIDPVATGHGFDPSCI